MKPGTKPKTDYHEIACQQLLVEDNSVYSIQWVVIPGSSLLKLTSDRLLDLYLGHIEHFTCSIFRPVLTGNSLEFRLGSSPVPLIKFSLPVNDITTNSTRTTLCISGGFLVQARECARGQLDFLVEQVADGTRISLQLSDYCPLLLGSNRPSLLRKWLYRLTQAYIHKVFTIRFLSSIYKKLTGGNSITRVVKVAVRKGEET